MLVPDRDAFWNHIAKRFGDARETSVDVLEKSLRAEYRDVDRGYVIAALKALAKLGLGTFKTGRRGKPSRMTWVDKPRNIGPGFGIDRSASESIPRTVEHEIALRPDVFAKIRIPSDITPAEAARICEFLRLIPIG